MAGLRITAAPVGGGKTFVLADGTNRRGSGGRMAVDVSPGALFEITYDSVFQESQPLGGVAPVFFDRNLESGAMPCAVEYEFTTGGAAFSFCRDLRTNCPRLAHVTVTFGEAVMVLHRVQLRPLRVRLIGVVSVRVDYPLRFTFDPSAPIAL